MELFSAIANTSSNVSLPMQNVISCNQTSNRTETKTIGKFIFVNIKLRPRIGRRRRR